MLGQRLQLIEHIRENGHISALEPHHQPAFQRMVDQ
jgi:hypothetical protein